jgi:hypothetical protein
VDPAADVVADALMMMLLKLKTNNATTLAVELYDICLSLT